MEEKGCDPGAEGEERTGRNRPERKGGAGVKKGERDKTGGKKASGNDPTTGWCTGPPGTPGASED